MLRRPRSAGARRKVRAGTTLGPHCRVGGEVEASIVHGHSNKYHDGFLGHGYVGEWVNLGAGTHNSDLRNDYGEVAVTVRGRPSHRPDQGRLLPRRPHQGRPGHAAQHRHERRARSATCCRRGAAPKYVPSFTSWWNGSLREVFATESSLMTAQVAMQRRGVELTEAHRGLYAWLYEETAEERRRALRESEQRQLRRSA